MSTRRGKPNSNEARAVEFLRRNSHKVHRWMLVDFIYMKNEVEASASLGWMAENKWITMNSGIVETWKPWENQPNLVSKK